MNELKQIIDDCFVNQKFDETKVIWKIENNLKLDSYHKNAVLRLLKTLFMYKKSKALIFDLLKSMRSYLLAFETTVSVDKELSDTIIQLEFRFGLHIEGENSVYAVYNQPAYTSEKFVISAFKGVKSPNKLDKYFLGTSPYIYNLTKFKYYKSIEQKLSVTAALNLSDGYTGLISMSTGGGKSLITQSIAYQSEKSLTIVVVPTVSLAIDQAKAAGRNIKHNIEREVFRYFSGMKEAEVAKMYAALEDETAKLIFISPEAIIKNKKLCKAVDKANESNYLKNIVIDEAHILIEWGAFFRVDYQCLEAWRNKLMSTNKEIRTVLLSATFEKKTVANLKLMFSNGNNWLEIRCDSLRKEPRYIYVEAKSFIDKKKKFLELVELMPHPMIVYVTSPDMAEQYKVYLNEAGFLNVETFTGKTKSGDRDSLIERWGNNEFDIIIATSAFGVGVDKDDVRTVLHMYIPENANKYYQELGRGGRDGKACLSIMCVYPKEDLDSAFGMTDKVLSTEKIVGRWFSLINNPLSERYDNTILIDTSIKPKYNISEDDYYMEEATDINKVNMQWNIYVLLLLRRYCLIKILNMILVDDSQKYLIKIEITDYLLLFENTDALSLIDRIRTTEKEKFENDFFNMRTAILNNGQICWSNMFYSTYEYVSEYCAGCAEHDSPLYTDLSKFPLKTVVDNIRDENCGNFTEIFINSAEAHIIGDKNDIETINYLIANGLHCIVVDDALENEAEFINLLLRLPEKSNVSIIGIKELSDIVLKQSWYYVSGAVLMIYSDYSSDIDYRMMWLSKKIEKIGKSKVFHMVNKNKYIKEFSKNIYELIEGPCFEAYMLSGLEE